LTNKKTDIEILKKNLENLAKSRKHLLYSYNACRKLKENLSDLSNEYLVHYEALTARYGRTIDILVNSVLRVIDIIEYVEVGTIIDVINRAEKRKFVDTADELRSMKNLRNEIVHTYDTDEYEETFGDVLKLTPAVFSIIDKVNSYCEKYTKET